MSINPASTLVIPVLTLILAACSSSNGTSSTTGGSSGVSTSSGGSTNVSGSSSTGGSGTGGVTGTGVIQGFLGSCTATESGVTVCFELSDCPATITLQQGCSSTNVGAASSLTANVTSSSNHCLTANLDGICIVPGTSSTCDVSLFFPATSGIAGYSVFNLWLYQRHVDAWIIVARSVWSPRLYYPSSSPPLTLGTTLCANVSWFPTSWTARSRCLICREASNSPRSLNHEQL